MVVLLIAFVLLPLGVGSVLACIALTHWGMLDWLERAALVIAVWLLFWIGARDVNNTVTKLLPKVGDVK